MPAEPGTTHEPEPGTAPKPATNARETGSLTVGSPNREEPSGTWRRRQTQFPFARRALLARRVREPAAQNGELTYTHKYRLRKV
jgi:hypothetical protein